LGVSIPTLEKKASTKTSTRDKPDTFVLGKDGVSKNVSCMMPDIESQTCLVAARQMTIISPKTTATIGTWNMNTMFESGRSVQSEMREMSLSWGWLRQLAQDRDDWWVFVGGLCTSRGVEGF
jgi:hypothetical protein